MWLAAFTGSVCLGFALGALVHRWSAVGIPVLLYLVLIAIRVTSGEPDHSSGEDTTGLLLVLAVFFVVGPWMAGTAIGVVWAKRSAIR